MQFHTGRSFTVTCVIVLVITRYTSNGFTIRKANLKNGPDLDTGESSFLEIRDNVTSTSHKNILIHSNNEEKIDTVLALNNQNNTKIEESKSIVTSRDATSIENTPPLIKTDSAGLSEHVAEVTGNSTLGSTIESPTTIIILTELKYNVVNTSTSPTTTAFQNSTSSDLDLRDKEVNRLNISSTSTEHIQQDINQTNQNISKIDGNLPILQQLLGTEIVSDFISEENHNVTSTPNLNDEDQITKSQANSNLPVYTIADSLIESKLISSTNTNLKRKLNGDSTDILSELHYNKKTPDFLHETFDEINSRSNIVTTKNSFINELTYFENIKKGPSTTEFLSSHSNTKNIEDKYITTLSPLNIHKIKEEEQISELDSDHTTISEVINTGTNFPIEKSFSVTALPSILHTSSKKDFAIGHEHSAIGHDGTTIGINHRKSTPFSESISLLPARSSKAEQLADKPEIFSTNRAGYLDNSETTTMVQETTSGIYLNIMDITNDTDSFGSIYETDVSDSDIGEGFGNKNTIAMKSQSQLADDAIKEELLIEKTLNENDLSQSRRRNFHLSNNYSIVNDITTTTESTSYSSDNNVVPTGNDKRKNTILYTLSSKYKPPKKLEVQPTKPFVRDPDDNSWRNESISSLGIVFKAKNPSKSFTEVLKNKTTELSHIVRNDYKNELPELRLRLEKMTEVRKSKKKRINKFGDTMYSDYEESSENTNYFKEGITSPLIPDKEIKESTTTSLPIISSTEASQIPNAITDQKFDIFSNDITTQSPKEKMKKLYNLAEYYDTTDDYDADYATLPKIDIKKFSLNFKDKETIRTPLPEIYLTQSSDDIITKPMPNTYQGDRQATVQYFPPTKKVIIPVIQNNDPKVTVSSFGDELNNNKFSYDGVIKTVSNIESSTQANQFEKSSKSIAKPLTTLQQNYNLDRSFHISSQQITTELPRTFVPNDGNFNRASYIIKHYGDFINDAAKSIDEDRSSIFLPYTNAPIQGVTLNEVEKFNVHKQAKPAANYDYDSQFRNDVVNRFVDNFNQNSDRFKVDFPIIYNSSVVHTKYHENGKVLASSNMFMKRLHETRDTKSNAKLCDFNCERMTIEISPSYELHYYVPEQEEAEVMQPRANTYPYRFTI